MQGRQQHTGLERELEALGGEALAAKGRPSVGKATFAAAIGATVEWYDLNLAPGRCANCCSREDRPRHGDL
jgi:hypothetical protein